MSHLRGFEASSCCSLDAIKIENILTNDTEVFDEVAPLYVDISQVKTECEVKDSHDLDEVAPLYVDISQVRTEGEGTDSHVKTESEANNFLVKTEGEGNDLIYDVTLPTINQPKLEATIDTEIKQENADSDDDLLEIIDEYYLDPNRDLFNRSQSVLQLRDDTSLLEYSIDIEEQSKNYSGNHKDSGEEISFRETKNSMDLMEIDNNPSSNTNTYSELVCHENTNKADNLEKNVPDSVQLTEQQSKAMLIEVPKTNWITIDMNNIQHEDVAPDETDLTIEYNPLEYQHVSHVTPGSSSGLTEEILDPTKKLLQCPRCPYETTDATHLEIHKKTHRFIFSCSICNYFAGTLHKVELHELKKHGKLKESIRCKYCTFTALTQRELKRHTSKEHGKFSHMNALECPECDYKSSNKCSLLKHKINHHQKGIKCPSCPRRFEDDESYEKHKSSHIYMEIDKSTFQCTKCVLKADTSNHIVEHYKNTHKEKIRHACYDCNYVFSYPSKFVQHKNNYIHKKNVQEL